MAKLRDRPKQWVPGFAEARYHEALFKVAEEADWVKVRRATGVEGYLHISAITHEPPILTLRAKGKGGQMADPAEASIAGKGLPDDPERLLRGKSRRFDFKVVDQIEKFSTSDRELSTFMQIGKLGETNK